MLGGTCVGGGGSNLYMCWGGSNMYMCWGGLTCTCLTCTCVGGGSNLYMCWGGSNLGGGV